MGREERGGGEEAAPSGNLVVEDEVEEFFAILRRMQAASRQLSGVGAAAPSGRIPPVGARQQAPEEEKRSLRRWLPAFEWEDFVEEGDRKIAGVGVSGEMSSATSAPTSARVEEEEQEEEEQRGAQRGISVFLDLNADPE
ncbi:unnamed protein product [Spirodela intermedia]|uniref:Uncharacterized protein n=1 Tax=Spirodela intermedia TaxID=51605 RepID=A0A7I8KYH3_SPIIN|nr:unnamed protein product [Spirodela intermedia]